MTLSSSLLHNRYQLLSVIGTGGFSTIYHARDTQTGQEVTIKEFTEEHAAPLTAHDQKRGITASVMRDRGLAQIHREEEMLQLLADAPGVPLFRESFEENGTYYLVRDYLEGMTCSDYMKRFRGRLPFPLALYIMRGAVEILGEVHKKGYLHGDVSPVNIFLCPDGGVHMIDWGNAIDLSGSMEDSVVRQAVNVRYSAPEQQISGDRLTPATDLYCLAASIYDAIAGEPPLQAVRRLRGESLIPLSLHASDVPAFAQKLITDSLSVWQEDRPQEARQIMQALDEEIAFTVSPVSTGNSSVSAKLLHEKRSRLGFLTSRRYRKPTLL